jgi:cytidylate kinase
MTESLVITIDGPAASGKSTVARQLARKLNLAFLNTGAMYRAVTLAALQANAVLEDQVALERVMDSQQFGFHAQENGLGITLNGQDVSEQIRDPHVTANVRHLANAPGIRARLVKMQQAFAAQHTGIVTEGRDQGTVVFPDAALKIFLSADPAERAKRRLAELEAKGLRQSIDQLKKAVMERDQGDRQREVGPLKPAPDAIHIDTTSMTLGEVVETILCHAKDKQIGA